MTVAGIGHNSGDVDGRKPSLRTQWAKALFADPATPPYVMAIAWAIHWFSNSEGGGAALSNSQLETMCGISTKTATRGKAWLRDNGYVRLRIGTGDEKTKFSMVLPTIAPEARVVTQSTLDKQADQGSPTVRGDRKATHPGHTVHPRVDSQATSIQERDSGTIQDEKGGAAEGGDFWQKTLNPQHSEVLFAEDGVTPILQNGDRVRWLELFDGNAGRLDMALIQIGPYLQRNSRKPMLAQVASQLARIIGLKMDRDRPAKTPATATTTSRFRKLVEKAVEEQTKGRAKP